VSNNPDAAAILWKSLQSGKVRYVSHQGRELEIEGSPDWILEIVSDSSVFKDTVQLRKAYHRARISEYWLVDARGKDIDFQILCWRKNGYVAAPAQNGWVRSRVFARWFRLTRQKDRRGGWKYTLEVKAQ
jgi:Uma2 family endonuclease